MQASIRTEFDELTAEFKEVERAVRAGAAPFDRVAAQAANKFRGVYPYPENAVHTHCGLYVNASHMSSDVIAAQYPTGGYYARWWSALLQARVQCILMLAQTQEAHIQPLYFPARAYCATQFEDQDSGLCASVTTLCACWYAAEHVTLRRLHIQLYHKNTPEQRCNYSLLHLHYADWTDCTAPPDTRVLLLLEKQLRAVGGVCAVHCRAGIGRTGTFLALYMRGEGESAQSVVRRLRQLRPLMVHNFSQYRYVARFLAQPAALTEQPAGKSVCMAFLGYSAVVPLSVELVRSGEHVGWKFTGRRLLICLQDRQQLPSLVSRLRALFMSSGSFLELDRVRRRDWNGVSTN